MIDVRVVQTIPKKHIIALNVQLCSLESFLDCGYNLKEVDKQIIIYAKSKMRLKKSVEVQLFFDRFLNLPPISLLVFVDITLRRQVFHFLMYDTK